MSDEALGKELWPIGLPTTTAVLGFACCIFFVLLVYGQVAKRAGFPRWRSLGMQVPIVSSLLPIAFALVPWPVERKRSPNKTRKKRR